MLAVAILLISTPGSPADLDAFRTTAGIAATNRMMTERHRDRVVSQIDGDAEFVWKCRQNLVWEAWAMLADALDVRTPMVVRESRLRRLRWLLGDEAYMTGRMPCPIPSYGFNPVARLEGDSK